MPAQRNQRSTIAAAVPARRRHYSGYPRRDGCNARGCGWGRKSAGESGGVWVMKLFSRTNLVEQRSVNTQTLVYSRERSLLFVNRLA